MFEALRDTPHLLLEAELRPVQGDRFQPTGFADLGAAVYERPDGKRMLLVESAQSVANRLEHACLDGTGPRIAPELEGLPYVLVELTGEAHLETSSLVEAHRINSPFIISCDDFKNPLRERAAYMEGQPLDWKKIARAIFHYDPNSLLHGVFMANLGDGRIKVARAITGFIEASNVREAASGGVKNNPFDPKGEIRAVDLDKDVYGNVPYHRMEYTAERIVAYFNLDLSLLSSYALPPSATDLLIALGLYKVRRFLSNGLRLRTACSLMAGELKATSPAAFSVPNEKALLEAIKSGIAACAKEKLFADPATTRLSKKVVRKKKNDKKEEGSGDETSAAETEESS